MTYPPMRKQIDVQREHDLLMTLMDNPQLFCVVVPREYRAAVTAATDALCWVLHHDVDSHDPSSHAAAFSVMLQDIRETLESIGGPFEPMGDEYIVDQEG